MELLLNYGFAWISVILAFILSIIFLIRIAGKKSKMYKDLLDAINRNLRKYHKQIGVLLIITGLIHGLFSSSSVLSFNLGTICWLLSVFLGINWVARKHLSKFRGWMYYHRLLTLAFIITIVIHIVYVGGIQAHKLLLGSLNSESYQQDQSNTLGSFDSMNKQLATVKFKDGIFTGEAQGFRPGLKVSVEIKNNTITNIKVIDHNEVNSRFYALPIEQIPQNIIENQSTDVDTVSGATFTSIGVINAVNDALSKALVSGDLPVIKELPGNSGHRRN